MFIVAWGRSPDFETTVQIISNYSFNQLSETVLVSLNKDRFLLNMEGKLVDNDVLAVNNNTSSVLLFTVTFALTYWVIQSRQTRRRYPPALRSLPFIGSTPFLPSMTYIPEFFRQTSINLKSSVFSFMQGTKYAIVLNSREAIKEALVRRATDYADRNSTFCIRNYYPHAQRGIVNSKYNADFRKYHQLVLSILKEFGFGGKVIEQRIFPEIEDLTSRIKALNGEPFDPSEYLNLCTINVLISIVFGQRVPQTHSKVTSMADFYNWCINNSSKKCVDFCPPLRFLPKYKEAMKEIVDRNWDQHIFLLEAVKDHLKNSSDSDSFINRFAERENGKVDVLQLKEIIDDLFAAGSDTVATALHWSIYFMANNPEIQKRVRDEIASVVPSDRFPSLADMKSLPYMEAAVLECLRIRTVLPLSLGRYTMCDTQVSGYFVPAETRVVANLHSVHMNPDEFPEPEIYRPERFLDSDGKVTGREKVIAFSLGKRSCLGELLARQELFLLFSSLVQRFNILPPEGQDKVHSEPRFALSLVPTPFLVRLIPIED